MEITYSSNSFFHEGFIAIYNNYHQILIISPTQLFQWILQYYVSACKVFNIDEDLRKTSVMFSPTLSHFNVIFLARNICDVLLNTWFEPWLLSKLEASMMQGWLEYPKIRMSKIPKMSHSTKTTIQMQDLIPIQ